jgi:hypothetical protein
MGFAMRKRSHFASRRSNGWPNPAEIERYFLAPPGQRWFFETRNDSAGFAVEGVNGTEHLEPYKDRIDIHLSMWGHRELGVLVFYQKFGGGHREAFTSKGDMTRLREWVRSTHDTPLPVGLFIPYEQAWKGVKEFLETDGQLPKSIEWVANRDLPAGTFPDP